MGLINEKIKIELSSSNMRHYSNLGYEMPKVKRKNGKYVTPRGTKIYVSTKDLMYGSSEIVRVECDCCKKIYKLHYYTYSYCNHGGLYYCNNCSSKILVSGENHPRWNSSISEEERKYGRCSEEYSLFVHSVLARDKYCCVCCGKQGSDKIEAHHLNGYNWYVEGRVDIDNGVTLCRDCHKDFHNRYGSGNNTKEQFEEWLGETKLNIVKGEKITYQRKVYCIETKKIYNSSLQASRDVGVSRNAMSALCSESKTDNAHHKSLKGMHFIWYDVFEKMNEKDVENFLKRCKNQHYKRVICLTTNKVFDTIKDAAREYNIKSPVGITRCCRGESEYSGKLYDGTKLKWKYYNE